MLVAMSAKHAVPLKNPARVALGCTLNLRPRILVVGDEPSILELAATILKHSGYEVDMAENGALAWGALRANNYDVLITDHNLPKVTGLALLKRIRATRLALPAILMSGSPPGTELGENPSLLIDSILLKPFSPDELLTTVHHVLFAPDYGTGEPLPPPNWQSQPASGEMRRF